MKKRPRLTVHKSNKYITAQLVDDEGGISLAQVRGRRGEAGSIGEKIAAMAKKKGVAKIVFDRSGFRYHGKVRELAQAARKGGLEF